MRLAILSDVHGNAFALEAVLSDIRAAAPDALYNLGDTVWGAADPARAWQWQAEFAPPSVRGNTDEVIARMRKASSHKAEMRDWLLAQLPSEVPAVLAQLPTLLDVAGGEVRLAHGSPRSPWEALLLTETDDDEQETHATSAEIRERLDGFKGKLCIVGHTHREMLRAVDGITVVNTGPVLRQKDGSPLARWVLLTRRNGSWNVEFRRVAYDVGAAVKWVRENAPAPFAANEIPWLERGCEP
ncbi:metallophosphoesterase family protein [Deinococcus detaillensis]|uniref:Metallophosphoesterase family protein n=1 Tax=Deinococcus detaillensis TaxID=2592048 RepID=A0A553UWP7_9DEIO|nr:metallophosphoesterase family protein [Deinococcus detaillensis]TSA84627.1 metallophosphoesterase family protein [Deinococcus detaillensis]